MLSVKMLSPGSREWYALADYAENCPWSAGKAFARALRTEDFYPRDRVFVLLENGWKTAGFCALCREDYIPDCMYAPWCSYVFVGEEYRGRGNVGLLLRACIQEARTQGYETLYVCTDHAGLYEKYGFRRLESRLSRDNTLQAIYARGTRY
ncbi:MAG: GNAT family N-acetyltransferase [Eubacteriales bacterium]|nr:GNAT family N-acetyltransferase [Eubacteriales bacterium]